MKISRTLVLVTAIALVVTLKLYAGDAPAANTPPANPFFATLSAVSPAELPAKAAELVLQADAKNRVETTINVVKAAVGLNPAAAAAIVGTIAQSTPEMAALAAATAVKLVPNQAIAIARAAAAAAPSQAGKIVEAVCRVGPSDYQGVANAVAGVAPGQGKAILAGVSASIPVLQDPINKVLVGYNGGTPSVSSVLSQVSSTIIPPTAFKTAITPVVAASVPVSAQAQPNVIFVPVPPVSPVNYSSGSGGIVPPGGRNVTPP